MTTMWLRLCGMPLYAKHGVYQHEKEQGTDFELDVELLIDATAATKTDNISNTADYAAIHDEAIRFSKENRFDLLEKWVFELAKHLTQQHELILECIIRIRKPGSAVGGSLEWIEVEYHHRKSS